MFQAGDRVTYCGHEAVVVHAFERTASIAFLRPVRGMSPQLDMWTSQLVKIG